MKDPTDLFAESGVPEESKPSGKPPLPARMRPKTLDEIGGQEHLLGPGKLLRRIIEADRFTNLIFYGPPGCGKTTLAEVIALATRRRFERCSGVLSNVATIRAICETAKALRNSAGTVLFIDEIHRFNKAQQDVLLPHVEDGTVTLIGATTHHPQIFINTPLTSRSLVFELKPLAIEAVRTLLLRALSDAVNGLGKPPDHVEGAALDFLADICEGDARRALTALEVAVLSTPGKVTLTDMEECVQRRMLAYDRDENGHYDTISAFIKSVRGSDPDAAIYWLARMLEGGEDPRFIARRLVILASEDIGNADPRGLTLAVSTLQAVEFIGMPEARITLAQATTYLATAPKSNAAYLAVDKALDEIRNSRSAAVPEHLKNVPVQSAGKDAKPAYLYPHDFPGHHIEQQYAPTGTAYYVPTLNGYEETIAKRMALLKKKRGPDS